MKLNASWEKALVLTHNNNSNNNSIFEWSQEFGLSGALAKLLVSLTLVSMESHPDVC